MTIGDGSTWDETNPTNSTLAVQIDDYDRDLRVGVRSRMATEHEWPSSQSATNQAGQHKFVTMQNQATKPTVSGTQLSAVYTKTVGGGLQELFWENEAGTEVQITSRSALNVPSYTDVSDTSTSDETTTSSSYTDTTLTLTFTVGKSGLVFANFSGSGTSSSGIDFFALLVDGTIVQEISIASGQIQQPLSLGWNGVLAAGSHTIKIQFKTTDGSSTMTLKGTSVTSRLKVSYPS